jgi:hypothetical protein
MFATLHVPDGLLADMLAHPADTGSQHREFESLERIGAWERVIAWAQAGQLRAIDSFMRSAEARNAPAAGRVDDAWALCNRLPASLVALEQGRITLSKARILHAETANLSDEHTAEVEQQVLAKAHRQTPGQLRVATRRAVLSTDPAAVRQRAEQARRERGVQMWPEPDGMANCRRHHQVKQTPGWSVTQHADGCTTWITPPDIGITQNRRR